MPPPVDEYDRMDADTNRRVRPSGGPLRREAVEKVVNEHRFKVGQTVSYISGPFGRGRANGIYKVTQLLPAEGDDNQYRIKGATEPHERVVKESQLDHVV
jgi:hypothetical protein